VSWYRWELREYPGRRKRWVVAQTEDHQVTHVTGGRGPQSKGFRDLSRAEAWLYRQRDRDKKRDLRRGRQDDYEVRINP